MQKLLELMLSLAELSCCFWYVHSDDDDDAKETLVGITVVLELVRNSFLRTTRRGLLVVGLAVVDDGVGVVPDRIAGRVRFLKKGTVDKVLGVELGGD